MHWGLPLTLRLWQAFFFFVYTSHMSHQPVPEIPADAPKEGEQYRHYKGDPYKVVGIALDSNEQWVVAYEPLYEHPAAPLFTRPVSEWRQEVEWEGKKVARFSKI